MLSSRPSPSFFPGSRYHGHTQVLLSDGHVERPRRPGTTSSMVVQGPMTCSSADHDHHATTTTGTAPARRPLPSITNGHAGHWDQDNGWLGGARPHPFATISTREAAVDRGRGLDGTANRIARTVVQMALAESSRRLRCTDSYRFTMTISFAYLRFPQVVA